MLSLSKFNFMDFGDFGDFGDSNIFDIFDIMIKICVRKKKVQPPDPKNSTHTIFWIINPK